jgi:hypothetical protein
MEYDAILSCYLLPTFLREPDASIFRIVKEGKVALYRAGGS